MISTRRDTGLFTLFNTPTPPSRKHCVYNGIQLISINSNDSNT